MLGVIKSGYTLKLQNFEGPLDLLTELISGSKLNITDVNLSSITDQYLHYLKTMQLFNIDLASEFFVIAATLVYFKSRKLLPHLQSDDEEIMDEQELLIRLKEYKKFRFLARELEKIKESGDIYYRRGTMRSTLTKNKSVDILEVSIGDLINALRRYKGSFIKKAIPIKRREVNVEQKMKTILSLLKNKKMIKFSEISQEDNSKVDIIASFLGSVELGFRQKVLLKQLKTFADINITRRDDIIVT